MHTPACVCIELCSVRCGVSANGAVAPLSVPADSRPCAVYNAYVPFSLFLKFLRLEIMYFPWPKMKALEQWSSNAFYKAVSNWWLPEIFLLP